jgi:hypothetical protein
VILVFTKSERGDHQKQRLGGTHELYLVSLSAVGCNRDRLWWR